jgi:hypothetical protein
MAKGKGQYLGARADQKLRTSEPARPPVNSTFAQLWLFLATRFLSSTVFASPLRYLAGRVMDLLLIVFDLDAHETWVCLPVGALQHFPAVVPSDGRRIGLWQRRSVCIRSPVGRCVAVAGVVAVGDRQATRPVSHSYRPRTPFLTTARFHA